jgi:hypothetical protein
MTSRWTLPLLVLVLTGVVYGAAATSALRAGGKPATAAPKLSQKPAAGVNAATVNNDTLPLAVQDMREAILSAARTGRIEELRTPIEMNELRPETGAPMGGDIPAYWRSLSADGQGLEVMAAMVTLLDTMPATSPLGADIENNRLFVWPGFSTRPLSGLSPAEEIELLRLAPAEATAMKSAGRYTGWRLAVGADGTWHSFQKMQ